MGKITNRQIQEQTQQQMQTLSPQQVLEVRLLQLTTVELEERVRAEVLENPALEEGAPEVEDEVDDATGQEGVDDTFDGGEARNETSSADDYRDEDDVPDYNLWDYKQGGGERPEEIPFSDDTSFYEILKEQLGEHRLLPKQERLCEYLIGSLDDDGLLHKNLSDIADELTIYYNVETDERELEEALQVIQTFDPAGIGGRSLQECLLLQVERKEPSRLRELQKSVLTKYYDDFSHKRWERIMQKMDIDKNVFNEVMAEVVKLNPRPGTSLGESVNRSRQQIIPDFLVDTQGEQITLSLNRGFVPQLRVSSDYMLMLQEQAKSKSADNREAAQFLKHKIDAAKGFIDAVKQREKTMTDTMWAIIDFQRPFFLEGDESLLKPMILKDIAERTPYDISTVSRVSNSKYVQTSWGIYPLKYFFSDRVTTQQGDDVSVREIHKWVKTFIEGEDKENPLTDDKLATMLQEKGYPTARRTVAKYREQLHLPVARLRKNDNNL